MFFKDGNKYKGEFRSDLPWGKGRMFGRSGELQVGIWEKGEFIREMWSIIDITLHYTHHSYFSLSLLCLEDRFIEYCN